MFYKFVLLKKEYYGFVKPNLALGMGSILAMAMWTNAVTVSSYTVLESREAKQGSSTAPQEEATLAYLTISIVVKTSVCTHLKWLCVRVYLIHFSFTASFTNH